MDFAKLQKAKELEEKINSLNRTLKMIDDMNSLTKERDILSIDICFSLNSSYRVCFSKNLDIIFNTEEISQKLNKSLETLKKEFEEL